MLLSAFIALIALSGVVALILPPTIGTNDPRRRGSGRAGIEVIVIGIFLLLWCVRDFYVSGKGTLAPWQPPKQLVIIGLYRHVRNPMYISVVVIVAGWGIYLMSLLLFCYVFILATGFHIRVVRYEEPWLKTLFGPEWRNLQFSNGALGSEAHSLAKSYQTGCIMVLPFGLTIRAVRVRVASSS